MQRNAITDLKQYRLTTLLHEVGHAFGLADTYIDSSPGIMASRFSIASTGGDSSVIGKQPLSVMNKHSLVALDHLDEIDITDDDRNGIEWLYRRYVIGDVKSTDCLGDYQFEASTNGCTPKYLFIHTARQGNIDAIDRLLKGDSKIDINQQDSLGNTALHYAATKEYRDLHGDKLYLYLQSICHPDNSCSDPTIANNVGKTAEELFGDNDDLADFRRAIIAALANSNTLFATGLIKAALVQGYANVVEDKAIKDRANNTDIEFNTMLHHASKRKWVKVARALLDIPATLININLGNIAGETALHLAAGWGSVEIVDSLLNRSEINTTITTKKGQIPLHNASIFGNKDIVTKLLAQEGVEINAITNDKKTPLHLAAAYNWDNRQAVSLLLAEPEINVNAQTVEGHTSLHLAAQAGRSPVVVESLLANKKVDPALTDNEGKSALQLANEKKIELDNKIVELQNMIRNLEGSTSAKDINISKEYLTLVTKKEATVGRYAAIIEKLRSLP